MTGRRVLVLLSCSLAVAAIALVAGIVDFDPRSAPSSPSPVAQPERDATVCTTDVSLRRQAVEATDPATWDERVEPGAEWDGPTLSVQAHFRVRPAGAAEEGDFTCGHPVSLWADGILVATSDPPGLRLPATARDAVFKAVGYRQVSRPVPPAVGGKVDFGNVVFEPDAAVRVHLADAPIDGGQVRFVVGKALAVPYAEYTLPLQDGSAEAQLPAPSGEDLQVSAFAVSDPKHNRYFAAECRTIRLESGETGAVELRLLPCGRITVEVRGPSATLSSWLTIQLWDRSKRPRLDMNLQTPRSTLDAQGRAVFCVPEQPCELGVEWEHGIALLTAVDGSGSVQKTTDGALLVMAPVEPLVGIFVRNHGDPVLGRLTLLAPEGHSVTTPRTVCHPFSKAAVQAAKEFHFQVEDGGSWHTCKAEDVQTEGDLVWLDVERSPARCRLTVSAEVPSDYHSSLSIRAEPLAGGAATRIGSNRSPFDASLPCGTYRLRWSCQGGDAAVIAERLELAAGEHREIAAFVPLLDRWDARIRDQEAFGQLAHIVSLRIGDVWSIGGGMPGQTIPFLIPAPAQPGPTAEICLHALKMTVPGRITALDTASHTFIVEHDLAAADRVRVRTRGLGSGQRSIWLTSLMADSRIPAFLGDTAEVPIFPGSERTGCLLEQVDKGQQVTCWFTLRHGTGELLVEPHGHWTTVRVEPACAVSVFVDVPAGVRMPAAGESFGVRMAGQIEGPGECRVFVADGSSAVRVMRPQGTMIFPADQAEIVVH